MPATRAAAVHKLVQYLKALQGVGSASKNVWKTFFKDCSILITAFGDDEETSLEEYDIILYHDYNSTILYYDILYYTIL